MSPERYYVHGLDGRLLGKFPINEDHRQSWKYKEDNKFHAKLFAESGKMYHLAGIIEKKHPDMHSYSTSQGNLFYQY